jgi:hypothetical protein
MTSYILLALAIVALAYVIHRLGLDSAEVAAALFVGAIVGAIWFVVLAGLAWSVT